MVTLQFGAQVHPDATGDEDSGCKSRRGQEWKKLETIPAWNLENINSKKEVILVAQRNKKKVHFATLMDICHLENAELEPELEKYEGSVVLLGRHCERQLWSQCSLY